MPFPLTFPVEKELSLAPTYRTRSLVNNLILNSYCIPTLCN